eukprot:TRINITY_DN2101_c0_g1_i3.p1 TRINITY_DN2101_c0_g1~~TRINITY_DN2101_c0_g1_i3.p1  ORF type:complete len:268 (+),score=91.23 TRINITY_DN2101_c0_g1_i3:65-805(+)
MDAFDDAFGAGGADAAGGSPPPMGETGEVDPAAEFLAKEQEDLGGLGEDLGFTSAPQNTEAIQNGDMNFDFLSEAEPKQPAPLDENPTASSFDQMDSAPPQIDADAAPVMSEQQAPVVDNLSTGFNNMKVREEPESIKKWKADQEVRLREKDEAEEKNKEDLRKQAAKELEDWYKRYEEQLQKTKETNRNEEENVVVEMNSIKPGTEWERVAKQCDFSAKNTRNTKDVSRMRSILLQLKQSPPTRD